MTAPTRARPTAAEPIRETTRRYARVATRVLEVRGHSSTRMVFLHGFCDSADTWRDVLRELAAEGISAIAVDLPGFGSADELGPGAVLPQLDRFLAAVVRQQARYGEVVLVGNSLGGTISVRAAQNHKLPIAGVVSIAAPGIDDGWLIRTVRRYPLPLRLYAALPLPVPGFAVREIARRVLPRFVYANTKSADPEVIARFLSYATSYRSTADLLTRAYDLVGELANAYQLEKVCTPLLAVSCGRDRLVRGDSGKRLHALVPGSRLVVLPEHGHCPQLDDPAGTTELLTQFAASCATGTVTSRGTGTSRNAGTSRPGTSHREAS